MRCVKRRITNDLHGTHATVLVPANGTEKFLGESRTAQIYRALCGSKDCTCGRIHGQQEVYITRYIDQRTYRESLAVRLKEITPTPSGRN